MCSTLFLRAVGRGGIVIHKDIISGPLNYLEQNGYLKFWSNLFGEMLGAGGGLVAFQSLSSIKKSTSPLNFQLIGPFCKFLRQLHLYEVPCSKKNNKKQQKTGNTLFPHPSLLRQPYYAAYDTLYARRA